MSPNIPQQIIGLSTSQKVFKRLLDVLLSLILIPTLLLPVSILIILATIDTKIFGLFFQNRVGQYGKGFTIYKIRTYNRNGEVSKFSKKIRKYKLDEIPQILNILLGQMSFVGPRPDVLEVMSTLSKSDQIILSIKPGLTGPASLYYFNEEALLAEQEDPIAYTNQILTPKKNAINKDYIKNYHIFNDVNYIYKTTLHVFQNMAL
ncbi:MAG: sugar transferase [Flavobacterium sp.]|jgi:lipopolysaccharide/colanic/teichoic acid biosynthesis glycosyltransferase|nr:sugar transferase [Flavobacterium sp.]